MPSHFDPDGGLFTEPCMRRHFDGSIEWRLPFITSREVIAQSLFNRNRTFIAATRLRGAAAAQNA
jgi:hypothetical protein